MDNGLAAAKRRVDEAEARFQNAMKQEGTCTDDPSPLPPTPYGSQCPYCGTMGGHHETYCASLRGVAGIGRADAVNECSDKPYRPPSTLERIEKEISSHQHEGKRVIKLHELQFLLKENPHVARILELKAELGF